MEVVMNEEDKAFNEAVLEVQQQVYLWKERTSRKFQKLEELIELAAQKLSLLMNIKAKQQDEGFVDAFGWKAKDMQDSSGQQPSVIQDSVCHLELRLPKFEGAAESSECLKDDEHQLADFGKGNMTQEWSNPALVAWEAYTGEPIYDEELGEGQDCWPEQEFILAALNRGKLEAPNPLQSEIFNSKISEEPEDYQEHPRYDEEPGEHKEDWQSKGIFLTVLGLEALSQQKPKLGEHKSSVVEGLDCTTDVRKPFASVPNAVVAHVPKKIHVEKVGETELRRTSIEIISVIKEGLNQPKELKPEFQASKDLTIQVDGPRLQCDSCLISASQDRVATVEEEHSIILTNMREELTEDVFSRDGQTVANSSGLDKSSSYLENKNMIIFDPGGLVQEDHSKGVNHNSKDMIRSEMQLKETVMKDSVRSELRHWQDFDFLAIEKQILKEPSQLQRKVFIIETKISGRLQDQGQNIQKESDGFDKIVGEINQQFVDFGRTGMIALPYQYQYMVLGQGIPEMNKSTRPESHEALRKSVAICIFDPGGDLSSLHGVQLAVSVGSKTCYLNHYPRCKDRWREVKKCKIHHEDMVVNFKGEGLSGSVSCSSTYCISITCVVLLC